MASAGLRCVSCRIDPSGANAFRNSEAMQQLVLSRAEAIASAAGQASGERYWADVRTGPQRCRAIVHPGTAAAAADNARNNTILKCVDAGRG